MSRRSMVAVMAFMVFASGYAHAAQFTGTRYFEHGENLTTAQADVRVVKKLGQIRIPVTTITCGASNALGQILGNVIGGKQPIQGLGTQTVRPQHEWQRALGHRGQEGTNCLVEPGYLAVYAVRVTDGSGESFVARVPDRRTYERINVHDRLTITVEHSVTLHIGSSPDGLSILR